MIQRLSRDVNKYVGAGVLGGTSHLYQLAAGGDLTPAVTGHFFAPLYTADAGVESRNTVVEANVSPGCSTVDGKLG